MLPKAVCRRPFPVLPQRLFCFGQASLYRFWPQTCLAGERSPEPGTNKIVTELPPKVFLPSKAFGPIVPYHQDRAKLKP